MSFFEPENIRRSTGGRWLRPPAHQRPVVGVATDTRESLERRAFIALRGERFDAHAFLDQALERGADLLVIEQSAVQDGGVDASLWSAEGATARSSASPPVPVLQVESTRRALGRLAAAYRKSLQGTRVIAITGSSGKTTTRRLIASVLAPRLRGTESPRSFNNDVGVPLTILSAAPTDKYLLVEIGMNAPGEIAELARLAEPDIGVVTSVGLAHLGGLGSAEAIAREKASLLWNLREGGLAVVNVDHALMREQLRGLDPLVTYGISPDADLRLTDRVPDGAGQRIEANGRFRCTLPMPGRHNAVNALAAIAVGRRMGLDDEAIAAGLAEAVGPTMRLARERIELGTGALDVVNDAYNANPDSVAAAIETFLELEAAGGGRRVAAFGDMLELGPEGPALHERVGEKVGEAIASGVIDRAIFVGPLMAYAADRAGEVGPIDRVTRVDSLDRDGAPAVAAMLEPGDLLLVKGSRGMAMERILDALRERAGRAERSNDG